MYIYKRMNFTRQLPCFSYMCIVYSILENVLYPAVGYRKLYLAICENIENFYNFVLLLLYSSSFCSLLLNKHLGLILCRFLMLSHIRLIILWWMTLMLWLKCRLCVRLLLRLHWLNGSLMFMCVLIILPAKVKMITPSWLHVSL